MPTMGQKAKEPVERPTQFEMGVLTFFDFGPPFDYYALYVVRPVEAGTQIERIILTPEGNKCFAPAKMERTMATVSETVDHLLGAKNPCEIPEKELKRELKRCKHCLTFSGANVKMQVNCGGETRLIRSDILDHDMFNPAVKTPENTSWTMRLLGELDKAAGPGVMDKPMFPTKEESSAPPSNEDEGLILNVMAEGGFDRLFASESPKLSDLYKQTQAVRVAHPEVTVTEIKPRAPENLVIPKYPPLSLLVHAQGSITANFTILDDGTPSGLPRLTGNRLLQGAVVDAIKNWRFPKEAAGEEIEATFEFAFNCPK
jgi:hypothetical protein